MFVLFLGYVEYAGEWKDSHYIRCVACNLILTTYDAYKSHFMQYHTTGSKKAYRTLYACRKCNHVSNDSRLAESHYLMHSHAEAKKCEFCCHLAMPLKCRPLTRHLKLHHGAYFDKDGKLVVGQYGNDE